MCASAYMRLIVCAPRHVPTVFMFMCETIFNPLWMHVLGRESEETAAPTIR